MAKFAGAHPEIAAFGGWAKSAPWTGSYAEEPYNGLNSFIFTDNSGNDHAVRWSLTPAAQPVPVPPEELAKRGPNFLETEIVDRIKNGPLRWTMRVTVANAGDQTADPSKAWPQDRRSVEVGIACRAADRSRGGRPVPRHQFRSDRPAERHTDVGRSVPRSPLGGLQGLLRPPHGRGERLSANRYGSRPMTNVQRIRPVTVIQRFTPLQRTLHWVMAVCILAMLFIGVGMVSTVAPEYLTLVSIHKPLGILILILALIRLVVRLRYGAPPLPLDLPEPMKLAAYLSHYALYALMIAMPLIGWAMLSAAEYPVVIWPGVWLPPILPLDPEPAYAVVERAFLSRVLFFALILMHLAAGLFHALIRRDGVFDAMGPRLTHDEVAPAEWRETPGPVRSR